MSDKKLLMVAVDGSDPSYRAFQFALKFAQKEDDILIVNVPKKVKSQYKGKLSESDHQNYMISHAIEQKHYHEKAENLVHMYIENAKSNGHVMNYNISI
jgi:nucleotide-binding universal stress UspA family protein